MTYLKKSLASLCIMISASVTAAPVFVGSWQVDQGPSWTTQPLAYTGQQAAALLFSTITGDSNPLDYVISTAGSTAGNINYDAWYSIIGYGGGHQLAQDYMAAGSTQAPGYYYSGGNYSFDGTDAASAYVQDNASGAGFTNYAFYAPVSIPEPTTVAILGLGLVGFVASRRKSKQ